MILVIIAFIRELLGSGTLTLPALGTIKIIPQFVYDLGYANNGLMILPPMALVVIAIIIWVQRSKNKDLIES